jgi:DNA-binding response OmpR family regulator
MNRGSILIIEDDREMCEELAEMLRLEGYSVDKAYNGKKGKRLVDSKGYATILLDLKLPTLDGIDLLQHIKRNHQARVIVITGKPLRSELHQTLKPDEKQYLETLKLADGFAEKPFEIESVLDSIRKLTSK